MEVAVKVEPGICVEASSLPKNQFLLETSQEHNTEDIKVEAGTCDEATDLLQNGILVETSKGLVCMSLNDALTSDLNLSVEDLRNVAAQLISQQQFVGKDRITNSQNGICDSDGFSSECSDSTYLSAASQSTFIAAPKVLSVDLHGSVSLTPTSTDKSGEESDAKNSVEILPSNLPIIAAKKKGRGGWPKGRKRKPELLNLPPKAPSTGYTLYLNEQRKSFRDSSLPFYEITKIIGNRWSSLTLEGKKPYLEKAEEDKKRYREELKQYRQSEAYRTYLNKKRKKKLQNNVLSESDMDATDDFDEEDNEELYCRTCDQWFHNLHNKKEHLQAKKHLTSVAGDIHRELSSDSENVLELPVSEVPHNTTVETSKVPCEEKGPPSINEAIYNLVNVVQKRETEIKTLKNRQQEAQDQQKALCQQLLLLNERYAKLQKELSQRKESEKEMEANLFQLWQVPSLFIITDFNADASTDFTTENTDCTE